MRECNSASFCGPFLAGAALSLLGVAFSLSGADIGFVGPVGSTGTCCRSSRCCTAATCTGEHLTVKSTRRSHLLWPKCENVRRKLCGSEIGWCLPRVLALRPLDCCQRILGILQPGYQLGLARLPQVQFDRTQRHCCTVPQPGKAEARN
jgi:hypothetical protein